MLCVIVYVSIKVNLHYHNFCLFAFVDFRINVTYFRYVHIVCCFETLNDTVSFTKYECYAQTQKQNLEKIFHSDELKMKIIKNKKIDCYLKDRICFINLALALTIISKRWEYCNDRYHWDLHAHKTPLIFAVYSEIVVLKCWKCWRTVFMTLLV